MIVAQVDQVFASHSAKPIPAVGENFDPNLHEAMVQMPSAEHPPGTVIQEMEKGYMLNDRVVRPARVIVSTAAIENEAGEGDTGGIDSDGTDSGDQQDDGKA